MAALRGLPGIDLIGASDATKRFALENHPVHRREISKLAQMVLDQGMMTTECALASPSQTLDLLARSALHRAMGETPQYLPLRSVLGPVDEPPQLATPLAVTGEVALNACQRLLAYIMEKGRLPTALDVVGRQVGPGALLRGIAALILSGEANPGQVLFTPGVEEPPQAAKLAEEGIYGPLPGWPPHDPNLRLDLLALHVRLQSWSLKPAVLVG
jgi:hypothetical protein